MWLGLCHPRGCRCKRGGVCGPFRVVVKAGIEDPLNRCPVCWFLVVSVLVTVVLDTVCSTDTILCCIWGSLFKCMLSLHYYNSI